MTLASFIICFESLPDYNDNSNGYAPSRISISTPFSAVSIYGISSNLKLINLSLKT